MKIRKMIKRALKAARREGLAAFVYGSMVAGSIAATSVASEIFGVSSPALRLLAFVIPLIGLPFVFRRLKGKREPYLIHFARGFREGFLPFVSLTPGFLDALRRMGIGRWLGRIGRKGERVELSSDHAGRLHTDDADLSSDRSKGSDRE